MSSISCVNQLQIPRSDLQLTSTVYQSIKDRTDPNKQYVYDKLAIVQTEHQSRKQLDQSINRSVDQSINQSIDQLVHVEKWHMDEIQSDDLWKSSFSSLPILDLAIIAGTYDYRGAMKSINQSINQSLLFAVNFADPHLFGYWKCSLLAQDELQALEFPELAMIQAYSQQTNQSIGLHDEAPVSALVWPVWRYADVDCQHLYGNAFRRAERDELDRHIRLLDGKSSNPPVACGILAIAAISGGSGCYKRAEIEHMLATAYTAFRSTVRFSQMIHSTPDNQSVDSSIDVPIIATGYWGCGAFGGSRPLMTAVQLIAARAAGVKLQYFTVSSAEDARRGAAIVDDMKDAKTIGECVTRLFELQFRWGHSNGT